MRHRLSLFTTLYTFFVLFMGNLVTATGAKDGCGSDWPKCNGSYIPDFTDPLTVIEYTHRLVTGGLGFLILINMFIAWKKKIPGEKAVSLFAPLTVILLFIQAFVGGLNVMLNTPPGFSTLDVSISLALFSSIIILTLTLFRKPVTEITEEMELENRSMKKLFAPALTAVIMFYMEITMGAFFKHSAASKNIAGIETSEKLVESLFVSEIIYYIHGIFTFVLMVSALWVLFYALRERVCVGLAALFVGLVTLEGLIGFLTFITNLTTLSSSLHMLTASITLGVGVILVGRTGLGKYLLTTSSHRNVEKTQISIGK